MQAPRIYIPFLGFNCLFRFHFVILFLLFLCVLLVCGHGVHVESRHEEDGTRDETGRQREEGHHEEDHTGRAVSLRQIGCNK